MNNQSASTRLLVVAFGKFVVGMIRTTGERVWEHKYDYSSVPRIAVTDRHVLVLGYGLSCLDLATGRVLWEAPAFSGTMLCDDRYVYIGNAGEVHCYAIEDGRKVWQDTFKGKGVYPVAMGVPGASVQVDLTGN